MKKDVKFPLFPVAEMSRWKKEQQKDAKFAPLVFASMSISSQSLCKISPFGNRVVEYVKFARLIVAKRSPSNQTFGEKRNVT